MTSSNIKMHVKQESVYNQKHPQTNSKQVLLDDNTNLEAYLKEGTSFRFVDGVLVYKDPVTGTDRTVSTSSLANRSVGNVSNLTLESLMNMANIKWEDPKDTTIATSGESVTITTWMGTKVVVKEGSVPRDEKDGTLVVDSKIRDQYKTNGLELTGLQLNKTYYVKLFPYTAEGIVTNDNTSMVTINTKGDTLGLLGNMSVIPVGSIAFMIFNDPADKTGVYKGQTYTTAQYAGTKVLIKKDSDSSDHTDGIVVSDYTTRDKYSTVANNLKFDIPSEGRWYISVFNYTTLGMYNKSYSNNALLTFPLLSNVTSLSVTSVNLDVTVKWEDPNDSTYFLETNHVTAAWAGTKLVRKEGSAPTDVNDGVLLVDSKARNQYRSSGYVDRGLVEGKTYFYKLFPYTDRGKITNSSANVKQVTPFIPDDTSGSPGPSKLLGGNTTAGYLGIASSSELISGNALATQVNVVAGTAQHDDQGWLKFMLDGKVLFVAKKPFRHSISYSQLKSAGVVDGSKVITIGNFSYKVRLLRGSAVNPVTDTNNFAKGSEWNRLMLPIHIEAKAKNWGYPNNVEADTPDWGIGFTDADLAMNQLSQFSSATWCQEYLVNSVNYLSRGMNGVSYAGWSHQDSSNNVAAWRPVLELIGPAFEDTSGSPGTSKTIVQGVNEGYFGEVKPSELISGSSLSTQIGLTGGTTQFDTEGWLKFNIDGKIIFVAKKPFRHSISWSQIDAVGAALGTKTISINGLTYKVRLLKGAQNNPSSNNDTDRDAIGSEWNRLMLPIHEQAKTKAWSYPAYAGTDVPDWGIGFTDADLLTHYTYGNGSYTWCQETVTTNGTSRVLRGNAGVSISAWTASTDMHTYYGWRPVLELVQ